MPKPKASEPKIIAPKFRPLNKHEISVRPNLILSDAVEFFLYKKPRVDATILDETVGKFNWQVRYKELQGRLFASVGINFNFATPGSPPLWVWKEDCGQPYGKDKIKSEATDSLSRAGFLWGIGKELYSVPRLLVPKNKLTVTNNGVQDKLIVEAIQIVDGVITGISLWNQTTDARALALMAKDVKNE